MKNRIDGAVAASEASAERLKKHGIRVVDLNSVNELPVYIDGADEVTEHLHMIKGGGGALTREKITGRGGAQVRVHLRRSKLVPVLGKFPVPIEVIPMARSYVAREIVKMGGHPQLRQGFTTDNGNVILDCHGMTLLDPPKTESGAQPDRRRGGQRHLRAPPGRCSAPRRSLGRPHQEATDWAAQSSCCRWRRSPARRACAPPTRCCR